MRAAHKRVYELVGDPTACVQFFTPLFLALAKPEERAEALQELRAICHDEQERMALVLWAYQSAVRLYDAGAFDELTAWKASHAAMTRLRTVCTHPQREQIHPALRQHAAGYRGRAGRPRSRDQHATQWATSNWQEERSHCDGIATRSHQQAFESLGRYHQKTCQTSCGKAPRKAVVAVRQPVHRLRHDRASAPCLGTL